MPSKPFHFKQFTIVHDRSTHKVGTDAVLLGSWVNILETDKLFLDIGTGSGIIALMLAQRTRSGVHIDAIDVHDADVDQARNNVSGSAWPEKVNVQLTAVQNYFPGKHYDLIVSNPPYFEKSLLPPDQQRGRARHAHGLSFIELLNCVSRLMSAVGRFGVILPYTEGMRFTNLAENMGLFPSRRTAVRSRPHKPIERVLLEFARERMPVQETHLTLYEDGDAWSAGYRLLTQDFYRKL